jgi:hypothetical protein
METSPLLQLTNTSNASFLPVAKVCKLKKCISSAPFLARLSRTLFTCHSLVVWRAPKKSWQLLRGAGEYDK